MKPETQKFLKTLLWVSDNPAIAKHGWNIFEFHPEFVAAVDRYIARFLQETDKQECYTLRMAIGVSLCHGLKGSGRGFLYELDSVLGTNYYDVQRRLGGSLEFEALAKFNGKIHLNYRLKADRTEALKKAFNL